MTQTYKFKWANYSLGDYLANMKNRAETLRQHARILEARAEDLDKECSNLESALLPAEESKENTA